MKKGYLAIKMNLGAKKEKPVEESKESAEVEPSKLDSNVQSFVNLIFNKRLMERAVEANGFDIKKLPLADLSKETID